MLRASVAATLLLLSPAAASAQDSEGESPKRDLLVTIGAGAQVYSRYPGSDELKLAPLPVFHIRKAGDPISLGAQDDGTGIAFFGKEGHFQMGPAIQFQDKRREQDVGAAVGNVGFTVEAGAFVQAFLSPKVRVRAEVRRGVGGHDAWLGDLGLDLFARPNDRTVMSIGPRLRWADGKYQRAYFGVTPAISALTGLAPHDPGGGLRSVGVSAGVTHEFSSSLGVYAYAGYDHLVGDAASSPIVRTFGSRSQPSAGVALTYNFTVRR